MILFAVAALAPVPLLAVGVGFGGAWVLASVLYMTVLAFALDQAIPHIAPDAPDAEFPGSDALLVAIALAHLAMMPLAVWAVGGVSGLSGWERAGLFFGFGMFFGQVSNPTAHELIHRGNRWLHTLGVAVYTTQLFGHHASAHRHVHHRHAASTLDPNTSRRGESYYRFVPRAWIGSFRAGLAAENALRKKRAEGVHPYVVYCGGAAFCFAVALWIGGIAGAAAWIGLALYATAQLLLSDYVQHYGLTRARLENGKMEPVSDRHSWNAPHWFTGAMMLNAARHSDHHSHPSRPYPALRLPGPDAAPWLPYSLPVSCGIALVPSLWRRVMHPRLNRWRTLA